MRPKNLLDLPIEMLEKIFSYVGYKKVSQLRLVSSTAMWVLFYVVAVLCSVSLDLQY